MTELAEIIYQPLKGKDPNARQIEVKRLLAGAAPPGLCRSRNKGVGGQTAANSDSRFVAAVSGKNLIPKR